MYLSSIYIVKRKIFLFFVMCYVYNIYLEVRTLLHLKVKFK